MDDLGELEHAFIHVCPNWGPEHVTDGTPCWCQPVERRVEGGVLVMHREPGN